MGERKIERETGAGERKRKTGMRERKIERETGAREREREIGRETEGGRETGEKEKKLQTQKIHGILSCRASIRLPFGEPLTT